MSIFSEIFQCCGKQTKQKEITVNIMEKRRATSCESTKRKTYIKRSAGKNPTLDLSNKNSMNTTFITTIETPSVSNKHYSNQQSYFYGENDYQTAIDYKENQNNEEKAMDRNIGNRRDYRNKGSKMVSRFINFKDVKLQADQQQGNIQNTFIDSYSPYNVPIQRQPVGQRMQRQAYQEEINSRMSISNNQNRICMNRKITKPSALLQTIEERLSLPSCSQSQIHSIQQNNSKTTLNFINEKEQMQYQNTPQTMKYESCIVQNQINKPKSIKLSNSQQIDGFQQIYRKQYQALICNKMKIDIEIYNNQLKGLLDQHSLLLSEKDYSRKRFEKEVKQLQTIKTELEYRIKLKEKQRQQIKQKMQF